MSSNDGLFPDAPAAAGPPMTRWQKVRLVIKVAELRLRFIILMAATGWVFANWDTLWNRYDRWMRPAAEARAAVSGVEHYCPMHPQVVQDEPGSCPICGMPLARRKEGEKARLPEGVLSRVELSPTRVRQAGIRTAEVGYAPMLETLTTIGDVEFDERRLARIVSKVPGKTRVEKLHADFTGKDVVAGEPLAELYSPELKQAIDELLTAARRARPEAGREARTAVGRSFLDEMRELVQLSAEKLRRWGITQAQIDEILAKGKSDFTIPILSPIGGHVVAKNVKEGDEVAEGFPMFEVADLHTVWVQARVYEHQVGLIREGQAVEATVEGLPGETFPGRVEFVQPHLDPETRTVAVRYSLKNPGHRLRPGMFATVTLKTPVAETPAFRARLAAAPRVRRTDPTAAEQQTCPVTNLKLGAMGEPVATEVGGRKVWTCCGQCPPRLKAQPAKYLARLEPPPRDQVLSVPESAVIDTGTRKVVYIETEPGVYEGRAVVLGPRVGDRFPVLDGLAPGEKVAAEGAFLIDAESRLNPAPTPPPPPATSPAPAESGEVRPSTGDDRPPRTAAAPNPGLHRH